MRVWIAPALALFLFCSAVACPKVASKVRVEGDKVYLPQESKVAQLHQLTGQPFIQFDANYPTSWPNGIKLPPSFHSFEGRTLVEKAAKNTDPMFANVKTTGFKGVTEGDPKAVAKYFEDQFNQAGWTVDPPADNVPPDTINIIARPPHGSAMTIMWVSLSSDKAMAGWTYLIGSYGHD